MPPNDYFAFKKFTIQQHKTAMKVCTDACILGAWASVEGKKQILDIGTGTGLLALMLAQRTANDTVISAIEIEPNAAAQAKENFQKSPYQSQINLYEQPIQQFITEANKNAYDCIVVNPPFYAAHQKSPSEAKNIAMHSEQLHLPELIRCFEHLLSPEGQCFVLLPPASFSAFELAVQKSTLHTARILEIYHQEGKNILRKIYVLSHHKNTAERNQNHTEILYIKENEQYTPSFIQLMKDYYLIF